MERTSNSLRLLFLNHNYRYSGTYYRAMPMAEQLAGRGHEVTLLTVSAEHLWRTARYEVAGVRVIETPGWGQNNSGQGYGPVDNGFRCWHALSHRYDIIHQFDHKPSATFAGFTGRLRGARLIADWADWWGGPGGINDVPRRIPAVGQFEVWWEEKSKLWADGVATISTVLRQRAIDIGCPPDRVLYLPTGAAIERIQRIPLPEARAKLGIPLARRMIGAVGGLKQEEFQTVMTVLQKVPDLWFMAIGEEKPEVHRLAHSVGVADRLWQTGFVPDDAIGLYLACADIFVLPLIDCAANRGRLPNKILDYMAAGRPIVASPVGDVGTILEQGGVGLPAGDEGFVQAVEQLLGNEPLREEMGRRAREMAETRFAWPSLIDRLESFYRSILETPAPQR